VLVIVEKLFEFIEKVNKKLKLNFGGVVVGTAFFCLSFTPSLLPRGYVLQGFVAGLSFATGYGVGVALAYFYHKLPRKRRFEAKPFVKLMVCLVLGIFSVVFLVAGFHWQDQVRQLTEAQSVAANYPIKVVLIAGLLAALFIYIARGMRHFGRFVGKKLSRVLPAKVALYGGGFLAAILLIFLINGVILRSLFGVVNYAFGLKNTGTPPGVYQSQDSAYSGSPASAIDWNTLGEKGREFVATGPSKADIANYSGEDAAKQPNRLYVGMKSAPTVQERADLLVKELDRTNAASRQAVLIAIPTGSGGIDAKAVQSVEYLYNGDTTTIGIQYSYLPSWISFLVDQAAVRDTGRVLTESVYTWWSHLDPAHRPKLLMYGESLGTLGADGAFSGISDIHNRMNGVLLVGPPNSNSLWTNVVSNRDSGTRQVLPTYKNGELARFADATTTLAEQPKDKPWLENRTGFLQQGSDPVVWASLSLLLHKPDWLSERRGSDVMPNMRWYPFVTFWQVGLDMPFAFNQTPGHGHRYGNSVLNGWADVLDFHLTTDQSTKLNQIIDKVKG